MAKFNSILVAILLILPISTLISTTGMVNAGSWNPYWGDNETSVVIADDLEEQSETMIISDGQGNLIVTWTDFNGSSEVMAQKIDKEGNFLWGEEGIRLTEHDEFESAEILSDGSGGFFAVYQVRVDTWIRLGAQHIDQNGNRMWGENGTTITDPAFYIGRQKMVHDSDGGFFVTWEVRYSSPSDLYAQRIARNGSALWGDEGGVPICTANRAQNYPAIINDGGSGVIISWRDDRTSTYKIYAQRVDQDGSVLWGTNGVRISRATFEQYNEGMISDEDGGAYVFWRDSTMNYAPIIQRINSTGNVQWDVNGTTIAGFTPSDLGFVEDGEGGAIVTWADDHNGDHDIFTRRFAPNGTDIWDEDGIDICTANRDQDEFHTISDGQGGQFVIWPSNVNGDDDLFIQHQNRDGDLLLPENGTVIVEEGFDVDTGQFDPILTSDSSGGIFLTFGQWDAGGNPDVLVHHYGMVITSRDEIIEIDEDMVLTFPLTSNDDDNATWSILDTDSEWISIAPSLGTIGGTPTNSDVGQFFVDIRVDDNQGMWDEYSYTLEVINTPPEIFDPTPPSMILEEEAFYLDLNSSDDGQGAMTWELETNSTWLSINSNTGELTGIPGNEDVGDFDIIVNVDDGNGGVGNYTLELIIDDVNDAPMILTSSIDNATEDEPYTFNLSAEDGDLTEDVLVWGIMSSADWLTLNVTAGILEGTPTNYDVGEQWVNISISDGRGGLDHRNYTIFVLNVNDAPEWTFVPGDKVIVEGDTIAYEIILEDIDQGDTITFSITSDPVSNISIDETTGEISWVNAEVGEYNITISATDGTSTIHSTFHLTVGSYNGDDDDDDLQPDDDDTQPDDDDDDDDTSSKSGNTGLYLVIIAVIVIIIVIAMILILKKGQGSDEEEE